MNPDDLKDEPLVSFDFGEWREPRLLSWPAPSSSTFGASTGRHSGTIEPPDMQEYPRCAPFHPGFRVRCYGKSWMRELWSARLRRHTLHQARRSAFMIFDEWAFMPGSLWRDLAAKPAHPEAPCPEFRDAVHWSMRVAPPVVATIDTWGDSWFACDCYAQRFAGSFVPYWHERPQGLQPLESTVWTSMPRPVERKFK